MKIFFRYLMYWLIVTICLYLIGAVINGTFFVPAWNVESQFMISVVVLMYGLVCVIAGESNK